MRRLVVSRRVLIAGLGYALFMAAGTTSPLRAQGDLRERTLFVSVTDQMNDPVEGLDIPDFIVREDGVRREVLRVSRATEPLDVAILVDNASASSELIPRARQGLQQLVDTLTPQHAVALIALADRPTILVDYTTSATALRTGIGRLFTMTRSGSTLFDGIVEVAGGLRRREAARAAIIPVVTDGIEYSNRRYQDILTALTQSGAGFYPISVGLFRLTNDTDLDRDRVRLLSTAPDATGGQQFNLLAASAVEGTLAKVARLLTSQYKVVYSRPETLLPPEKIEVSSTRTGLKVHGTPARVSGGSAR